VIEQAATLVLGRTPRRRSGIWRDGPAVLQLVLWAQTMKPPARH